MLLAFAKHTKHFKTVHRIVLSEIDFNEANRADEQFHLMGKIYLIDRGINVLINMIEESFPTDRLFNCKKPIIENLEDIQRTLVRSLEAVVYIKETGDNFILDAMWLEAHIKNMANHLPNVPKAIIRGQGIPNQWIGEVEDRVKTCERVYWVFAQKELPYSYADDANHMGEYLARLSEFLSLLKRFLTAQE